MCPLEPRWGLGNGEGLTDNSPGKGDDANRSPDWKATFKWEELLQGKEDPLVTENVILGGRALKHLERRKLLSRGGLFRGEEEGGKPKPLRQSNTTKKERNYTSRSGANATGQRSLCQDIQKNH